MTCLCWHSNGRKRWKVWQGNEMNMVCIHSSLHPLARTSHRTRSTRGDQGSINFSRSRKSKCWMCLLYIQSPLKLQGPRNTDRKKPLAVGHRDLIWVGFEDMYSYCSFFVTWCCHLFMFIIPVSWNRRCNSILIQKMFADYVQWDYNLVLILTLNTESEHKSGV